MTVSPSRLEHWRICAAVLALSRRKRRTKNRTAGDQHVAASIVAGGLSLRRAYAAKKPTAAAIAASRGDASRRRVWVRNRLSFEDAANLRRRPIRHRPRPSSICSPRQPLPRAPARMRRCGARDPRRPIGTPAPDTSLAVLQPALTAVGSPPPASSHHSRSRTFQIADFYSDSDVNNRPSILNLILQSEFRLTDLRLAVRSLPRDAYRHRRGVIPARARHRRQHRDLSLVNRRLLPRSRSPRPNASCCCSTPRAGNSRSGLERALWEEIRGCRRLFEKAAVDADASQPRHRRAIRSCSTASGRRDSFCPTDPRRARAARSHLLRRTTDRRAAAPPDRYGDSATVFWQLLFGGAPDVIRPRLAYPMAFPVTNHLL